MTAWRIDLFGGFQFRREGQVIAFPNRKDRLMLAFLALRIGKAVPRERLAGLLWGDRADEQARASLRQCLAGVREAFGNGNGPLVSTRESVALQPDPGLVIDTEEFARLRSGEGAAIKALALYAGPLLDGLNSPSAEYDHWLASQRARFEDEAASLISMLPVDALSVDEMQLVLGCTKEFLLRDRLREPLHQVVMRILARQQRWSEAARAYKDCCRALEEDLGVAPSEATTAVYRSIEDARQARPAHAVVREPREERPALDAFRHRTDPAIGVLCRIAACQAQLGRMADAGDTVAEIMKRDPAFRLSAQRISNWCAADVELFREGMLKAGLPD